MIVVGITGNLGTGKTTVAQMLVDLGAVHINADELGHEIIRPNTEPYTEILAAFGKSILGADGQLDRVKLSKLVFENKKALARLNRITHPKIYDLVKHQINEFRHAGTKVIVLEAALLIEAGWKPLVDQLWVTTAPEAIIVERLKKSRGLRQEQVLARLRDQMPQEEKARQADVVINTNCLMDELSANVTELWRALPV